MPAIAVRSLSRGVAVLLAGVALTSGCAGTARPAPNGATTGTASGTTTTTTTTDTTTTTATGFTTTMADPAPSTPVPTTHAESPAPAAAATVTTVDRCAGGGVPVVEGGRDAAMGARYVALTAINCTTAPIELSGFPQIEMFEADGVPVNVAPMPGMIGELGTEQPSHTVTVEPGDSASVQLSWRNLTETDAPVTAESVVVTPGAGLAPQTVPVTVDLGTTYEAYVTSWTLTPAEFAVPLMVTGTPAAVTASTG